MAKKVVAPKDAPRKSALHPGGLWKQLEGHQLTLTPLLQANSTEKLAGTLLFAGPSGIGKKFAALALAQALVCETPFSEREEGAGCGVCGACQRIATGQSEALMVVEPQGAQIKIEQARDILQFITLQKLGRARIILIDQAHLLGPQSGNALLKSLEEPPAGTHFVLISHLPNSILATLRSRSQLVRFKPLDDAAMKRLVPEADDWLLKSASGSVEAAHRLSEERKEFEDIENAVAHYLKAALSGFPGDEIAVLRELLKDRSAHGFVASLIQRSVTEAMKLKSGLKLARATDLQKALAQKSARTLDRLATKSLDLEADLARNVDRGLLLEAFAIELGRARNP